VEGQGERRDGQILHHFTSGEHRQSAKRAAADVEGHSEAAKFGQL
jgi:hypothetical protein